MLLLPVSSIEQRELLVGAILTLGSSKGGVRWRRCSTPAPRHVSKHQRAFRSMRRVSAGLGRKNSRCNARAVATRTNSWSVRPISKVPSKMSSVPATKPGRQCPGRGVLPQGLRAHIPRGREVWARFFCRDLFRQMIDDERPGIAERAQDRTALNSNEA